MYQWGSDSHYPIKKIREVRQKSVRKHRQMYQSGSDSHHPIKKIRESSTKFCEETPTDVSVGVGFPLPY